jgi:hypothetical protein
MLQLFHLDVAYVLQLLHMCFCKCFRHMMQVIYLDISKIDRNAAHIAMCPTYHNLVHARGRAEGWSGAAGGEMAVGAQAVLACNGKQGSSASAAGVEGSDTTGNAWSDGQGRVVGSKKHGKRRGWSSTCACSWRRHGRVALALLKRKWRHSKSKIGRKLLKPTWKTENGGNETASDMQQKVDSAEADRMR